MTTREIETSFSRLNIPTPVLNGTMADFRGSLTGALKEINTPEGIVDHVADAITRRAEAKGALDNIDAVLAEINADAAKGEAVEIAKCDGCDVLLTDDNFGLIDGLCAKCADDSEAPYCGECQQPCLTIETMDVFDGFRHECWIESDCCKSADLYQNAGCTIEWEGE